MDIIKIEMPINLHHQHWHENALHIVDHSYPAMRNMLFWAPQIQNSDLDFGSSVGYVGFMNENKQQHDNKDIEDQQEREGEEDSIADMTREQLMVEIRKLRERLAELDEMWQEANKSSKKRTKVERV